MSKNFKRDVIELAAEFAEDLGSLGNPVQHLVEVMVGFDPRKRKSDLYKLIKRISDETRPARGFSDYEVTIDSANVPSGVTLEEKI